MQSLECVELFLFVLLPKMSVPDIKNLGLCVVQGTSSDATALGWCTR